jgi:lysyl-tRNA synthetase class 2
MRLLGELASEVFDCSEPARLTFREAFLRHTGIDPFGPLEGFSLPPELPNSTNRDGILDYLHTTRVEPQLGRDGPTILYDYPATQSALARIRPGNPPVAERFELYYLGIELANGYHELLDPAVLRQRNRENNEFRAADGKYTLPEESRLLQGMQHGLPPCSGCALGFDRLVMVATGAKTIQEVMAFPVDRA